MTNPENRVKLRTPLDRENTAVGVSFEGPCKEAEPELRSGSGVGVGCDAPRGQRSG